MNPEKEIRKLLIEIPEPTGERHELREVHVTVIFADGNWSDVKTFTSMHPWESSDLLETVKKFVSDLERG